MKNFWQSLAKPFYILAPMDEVTDVAFRQVVHTAAPADVYFTEFANVDGYCSPGKIAIERKLRQNANSDQPLVAQIWGLKPENYRTMAADLRDQGFAGIDINMGCPDRKLMKTGACAALINNPSLAAEIIAATKDGAGDLPVSVKTRIGVKDIVTEEWISFLLKQNLAALTVHARTAKDMSAVPARWEEFATVIRLRNELAPKTLIIGNGDIWDRASGDQLVKKYGLDGVMIGRGIFKNLFAFGKSPTEHTWLEKKQFLLLHIDLFEQAWGIDKNYNILKRFFKVYVNGFDGASDLRVKLMKTKTYAEARSVLSEQ